MRLTRRLLVLSAVAAVLHLTSADQQPLVSTQGGQVRGTVLNSFIGNQFFSFKGVPFAEPPVGALRFELPRRHRGWSGVLDAKEHGAICLQFDELTGEMVGDEDCLFLNVYTPKLPSQREPVKLPVMVWIHGGGFIMGKGDSAPFFGPEYLMDQQIVLVSINYRLGPFGFFTTGDANAPGNYGLHDQALALEWVKANIAAFGGDPDAVTIFGESAGGSSVSLVVLSPRARGLFARAISQSGASFSSFSANGEPQGAIARDHGELLNCDVSSPKAIADCFRQKPATEILLAMPKLAADPLLGINIFYKPRVDADSPTPFLPEDPYVALREGRFNRVPWMNGQMRDECAFSFAMMVNKEHPEYLSKDWSVWAKSFLEIEKVARDPAAVAEQVYRFYLGNDPVSDDNLNVLVAMLTDRHFTMGTANEIELASAHAPVYKYVVDHTGPGRQRFGAFLSSLLGGAIDVSNRDFGVAHADDLLYLFKNGLAPSVARDSDEHKMIRFMVSVWTSFARHGYPSSDVVGMPPWPAYSSDQKEHMWLNLEPSVGRDVFGERVRFWNQLDIQENWRGPLKQLRRDEL